MTPEESIKRHQETYPAHHHLVVRNGRVWCGDCAAGKPAITVTPRELVLATVLADSYRGPAVALSGRRETPDETPVRAKFAMMRCYETTLSQGDNTWEEARSAIPMSGSDLTIVTSAYHQLRAFLTFLQAADYSTIRLWNLPVPGGMDRLAEEFEKIERYQAKGHCASYERAVEYLAWRGR